MFVTWCVVVILSNGVFFFILRFKVIMSLTLHFSPVYIYYVLPNHNCKIEVTLCKCASSYTFWSV